MVFRKKSEGGSVVRRPRKPRDTTLAPVKHSARLKKKQMYALDLLATVAESLSSDEDDYSTESDQDGAAASHNSDRATVKSEQVDEAPQLNSTALENGCCRVHTVGCDGICASLGQTSMRKTEDLSTQNVADTVEGSLIEKADTDNLLTQNVADAAAESLIEKKPDVFVEGSLVSCTKPCLLDCGLGTIPEYGTIGVCHPCFPTSEDVKQVHQVTPAITRSQVDGNATALHGSVDTMDLDIKPSVLNSESSSGVHLGGHDNGHKSSPFSPGEVQHAADIDNDEKSTRCVHPSTSGSKGGYLSYIGDCRTRRLFATRMRKAARSKMCGELPKKGKKKTSATRRKAQVQRMLKTKKVAECYSAQPSDEGILTETSGTSCSRGGQDPTCASESSQRKPCASEGCNVKFIIKSFNIPELSIEVPSSGDSIASKLPPLKINPGAQAKRRKTDGSTTGATAQEPETAKPDSPAPRVEPAEARTNAPADAPQPSEPADGDMAFPESNPSTAADDTTPEVVVTGTGFHPPEPHVLTRHTSKAGTCSADKFEFEFPVLEKLTADELHAGYLNRLSTSRNMESKLVGMMKKKYEEALDVAESKLTGLRENVASQQTVRAEVEEKWRVAVEELAKLQADFTTYKKTVEFKKAALTKRAEDAEGRLKMVTEELTGLKRHISRMTEVIFGQRSCQLSSDNLLKLKAVYTLTEQLYCGTLCTIKAILDERNIPKFMKGVIELLSTLPKQVDEFKRSAARKGAKAALSRYLAFAPELTAEEMMDGFPSKKDDDSEFIEADYAKCVKAVG